MAELVDALVSGTSDRKVVQVRLLFWVPSFKMNALTLLIPQVFVTKFPICIL